MKLLGLFATQQNPVQASYLSQSSYNLTVYITEQILKKVIQTFLLFWKISNLIYNHLKLIFSQMYIHIHKCVNGLIWPFDACFLDQVQRNIGILKCLLESLELIKR